MGNVLIASNANSVANKWVPYYWKTFNLGRRGDGNGSTDGNTYITQEVGTSAVAMTGFCTSSHNCGYYYMLIFGSVGAQDSFWVDKYDLNDNLIDTIYASDSSGDGRYWNKTSSIITIDIGVIVNIASDSSYDDGDKYKITLPSSDTMDKRKIYHGGYSTFMRMPYTEGIIYHSDVIPCNLKNKGMNINLGTYLPSEKSVTIASSKEDTVGNKAVTLGLEWNVEPKATHSNVAVDINYVDFTAEKWQLGTIFHPDIDPSSTTDIRANTHASVSDMTPSIATTGDNSPLNATVSGRAGHAKMYLAYNTGAGSPTISAYNQFWPVILTLT
jgi:hypothetical protein